MSQSARSRALPLIVGLAALGLMFAPVLWTASVVALGSVGGCRIDQAGVCVVAGVNLGEALKAALDAAWTWPLVAGGLLMLVLAGIATLAAHRAFSSFVGRFVAGGVVVAIALIGLVIVPVILVTVIAPQSCQINEAAVGDCSLYGVAQGMSTHSAAVAPWLLFFVAPAALAYLVVYLVILSILAVRDGRRQGRAP